MIKFDYEYPYSTNDKSKARCFVTKEIRDDIKNLQSRINKAIDYINKNLYLPMDLDKKNELLSILQNEEVKNNE